ncbi:MAG: hypothetical protein EZS28_038207 [Streblomastix strix]|uniref:Uncharacterized protein n=1 Tax=Streblomastix strix TaxID=222440 RepID=A0A5J4U602_9EUKA|nr:MAG: hypothetical protein EZS28_038207 [Streblomastix strix]
MDYNTGVAYRAIVEPLASNAISVRYLFEKRINISSAGTITTSDDQPIDVQQQTMQQIINNINTFPMHIICSLPALTTQEWADIYAAVGRTGFYGQFIAEVVSEWSQVEHIGVASPWFLRFI